MGQAHRVGVRPEGRRSGDVSEGAGVKSHFTLGQSKPSRRPSNLQGGAGCWSSGAVNCEVLLPGLATRWRDTSH